MPSKSSALVHPTLRNMGKWWAMEGRQLSRNLKISDSTSTLPGEWLEAEKINVLRAGTNGPVDVEAEADVETNAGMDEEADIDIDVDEDANGRVRSPA